jgi:hypothetical protein
VIKSTLQFGFHAWGNPRKIFAIFSFWFWDHVSPRQSQVRATGTEDADPRLALPCAQPLNGVRYAAWRTLIGDDSQPMKKTGTYDAAVGTNAHKNAGWRQPALLPPRGFEPLSESAQLAIRQAVTESGESVLAFCLALLSAEECDLAAIVAAWPCLSESIRARILGLVEGATASAAKG